MGDYVRNAWYPAAWSRDIGRELISRHILGDDIRGSRFGARRADHVIRAAIDRLERGVVTDFIYFHHNSFSYPVFNLADSAITVGVALILIFAALSGHPRE